MPDTQISQLPAAELLGVADDLVLASGGSSKRITGASLAERLAGGPAWTTVVKQADESRTQQGTPSADAELKFTPASGGLYEFEMVLVYASPTGGGVPELKFYFAEDASNRGTYFYNFLTTADAAGHNVAWCASGSTPSAGTAAIKRAVQVRGYYVGTGTETGLKWAQNVLSADATVLYAGSTLRYRRIN